MTGRAAALGPAPSWPDEDNLFIDNVGIFEDGIEALYGAGIRKGCSTDGTTFCPDDPVTRGHDGGVPPSCPGSLNVRTDSGSTTAAVPGVDLWGTYISGMT